MANATTSARAAKAAGKLLSNPRSTAAVKTVAASDLRQREPKKKR